MNTLSALKNGEVIRTTRLPRLALSLYYVAGAFLFLLFSVAAHAHGVAEGDKGYIQEISGTHLLPFAYRLRFGWPGSVRNPAKNFVPILRLPGTNFQFGLSYESAALTN